jgi:rfaE bifunctional protein kinase chain/domain
VDKETQQLFKIVDRFARQKIAVWGDLILDEHLYGRTRRISREAPVLILIYQDRELSLGGAGNSLQNLRALGAHPIPVGVIGDDAEGQIIINILKALKIPTKYLFKEKDYLTPLKTRILAGEENTRKQQILRIDRERKVPESAALKEKMRKALANAIQDCAGLIISDYNYLTVKEDIYRKIAPAARKRKIPVALDSRFRLLHFQGATVSTPNEPEVEHALKIELGDNNELLREAGKKILKTNESPGLLITRGSKGMALFEIGKPPYFIPIHGPTDIVDVTGAGDTVISVFTLALASGATFRQAAHLANYAGGVVVMKKGAATLTPLELKQAIIS